MRRILTYVIMMSLSAAPCALALSEPLGVSARDLALQPHEFYGKEIEVDMRCAMIAESQMRCAAANIRLNLKTISNEDGNAHMQRYCKGQQEAARPRCRVTLRFVSEGGRRDQQGVTQIRARDDSAVILLRGDRSD